MLTLYQAEWCPYSSAVRERLTELGLDFVARQVEPRRGDRRTVDEIPTLETEEGVRLEGTDAVFEYLATLDPWEHEHAHRAQYRAHEEERREETTARVLGEKAPLRMKA
jgi:glutathione S-transferase